MTSRARLFVPLVFLAVGCPSWTPIGVVPSDGAASDAGGWDGVAGQAPPGQYVPSAGQVPIDPPFTNPAGVGADWIGYFENFQFPSGSDVAALHFGADAAGKSTLTVVLGAGPPPPPPTDPYQPWPWSDDSVGNDGGAKPGLGSPYPQLIEGFAYTARGVTWQGSRLRFSLSMPEPWTPWCDLQTSYYHGQGWYNCAAGTSASSTSTGVAGSGGGPCVYTNAPAARCAFAHHQMCISGPCDCNATGCGVGSGSGGVNLSYDITFYGDHADGSALEHNLRLRPAAP